MEYKDYYQILGVAKDAKPEEIQKAYRKLARKFHPDVNKSPDSETRFKEVNEAHQVLGDPEKRAKYDRLGSAWQQAQRGGEAPDFEEVLRDFGFGGGAGGFRGFEFRQGGSGFSSFFETLFGGGPTARGGQWAAWEEAPRRSRTGADHQARLELSLEEAARGGTREITLSDPPSGSARTLRVTIPPGVRSGQRIRLGGQGGEGSAGGQRGNLYLTVHLLPHPRFRLEGANLHTMLDVAPWEAALGGEAKVRTLDGAVTVRIPAGSSSGRKIRLRGRGFPSRQGWIGDLFAEIRIVVPERLSEDERSLFEQLAKSSSFRPRED